MKKLFVFLCFLLVFFNLHAQKIAVMQFDAGSGVNQEEVNGISNMFLTFFNPDGFIIIERIEVDRVITELNFQKGNLTEKEMAKIGEILNLQYLVLGDINWVQNQYNVDTRVIDVATARIIATSGMTFNGGVTFRENIQKIAEDLARKLSSAGKGISSTQSTPNQQEVSILYGYLKVFPNDLGFFEQPPKTVISRINSFSQYGYNTWRIPTSEEVALMRAAALIGSDEYMVSESTKAGNVRLVTDQGTAEEVEAEKKEAAEKERIAQAERERLAEQRRIEEQKRLEEQREQRAKEEAKEREFKSSLTSWEKAYLGGLSLGYELKAVEYLKQGYPNGRGVYPGHVWTETLESNRDYDRYGYDFYLEISKNPDVNAYLLTKPEWFCAEIYDNSVYTTTYFSSPETIYMSRSKGKSYIHVLQSDDYENYTISRSDAARKPIMLGKRISSSEASRLISDFKTQKIAQIEREKKAKAHEERRQLEEQRTREEQQKLEEQRKLEEQQRLEEQRKLEEQRLIEEAKRQQEEEAKKTAKIVSVQVEHNVMRDGVKGMLIHIDFSIAGFKDVPFRCTAYFYYEDGTPIKDTNNNYCTKGGDVSVGVDFTPRYDSTRFRDFQLWIPNKEIHVDASHGPVNCRFMIDMYQKETVKFLNIDRKISFRMILKRSGESSPWELVSEDILNPSQP